MPQSQDFPEFPPNKTKNLKAQHTRARHRQLNCCGLSRMYPVGDFVSHNSIQVPIGRKLRLCVTFMSIYQQQWAWFKAKWATFTDVLVKGARLFSESPHTNAFERVGQGCKDGILAQNCGYFKQIFQCSSRVFFFRVPSIAEYLGY